MPIKSKKPTQEELAAMLREFLKLRAVYYSVVAMRGNRLTFEEVCEVVAKETKSESLLRQLDPRKREALTLFSQANTIIAAQLGALFNFKPRTSSHLARIWVQEGFLEIVDPSKRGRSYRLTEAYKKLITHGSS